MTDVAQYAELLKLAEAVYAGNTEADALEEAAKRVINGGTFASEHEERAERAAAMLESYSERDEHDPITSAVDAIADLLHYVARNGGEPSAVVATSWGHYHAERS